MIKHRTVRVYFSHFYDIWSVDGLHLFNSQSFTGSQKADITQTA